MIEFRGTVSDKFKLYLVKWNLYGSAISFSVATIIVGILITIVALLWEKAFLGFTVICAIGAIFWFIPVMMFSTRAGRKKFMAGMENSVPIKVSINNEVMTVEYDEISDDMFGEKEFIIPLSAVKKVVDVGDWYHFIGFEVKGKGLYCVCQKDLLTKGTLEEFEELFADKIVRKKKS